MSVKMDFEAIHNWPKYGHNRNVINNQILAPQPPHFYHNSRFTAAIPYNFHSLKNSTFRLTDFHQTRQNHLSNRKSPLNKRNSMSFNDNYFSKPNAAADDLFAVDNALGYIPMALTAANNFVDDSYGMNSVNWSGYQMAENAGFNGYDTSAIYDASFTSAIEAWDGAMSDPASYYGTPDSTYGSAFGSPAKKRDSSAASGLSSNIYTVPEDAILRSQSSLNVTCDATTSHAGTWAHYDYDLTADYKKNYGGNLASDDLLESIPPSVESSEIASSSAPVTATAQTPSQDFSGTSLSWRDAFILEKKALGWTYKEMKEVGGLQEAESTLRGRYRALTKPSEARVRNPKFQPIDNHLLKEAVYHFMGVSPEDVSDADIDAKKVPWKRVAEYIIQNGGTYHFGNWTAKKQWKKLTRRA